LRLWGSLGTRLWVGLGTKAVVEPLGSLGTRLLWT